MTAPHFVWTDLSTFDMAEARRTYETAFGWAFLGDESYDFAMMGETAIAAVFPMPDALRARNMPSFWMSYIHVADLDTVVEKAKGHDGAIIEVPPTAFDAESRIALIRDPSGAGFTAYEGPPIAPDSDAVPDILRYHHLPDATVIERFYGDLFDWRFAKIADTPWPTFDITNADGVVVAQAEEVPERVRGTFCYWMPCFAAPDPATRFEDAGITAQIDLEDGRVMFADSQGAHFMLRGIDPTPLEPGEATKGEPADPSNKARRVEALPWRAALALLAAWGAVLLNINSFWSLLFLIWTWPALKSGEIQLIDRVSRKGSPLLYWAIVATWVLLSLWLMWDDVQRFV